MPVTVEEELKLSYYREISELNTDHGVFLVKNIQSNRLYVKKILTVFSKEVYRYLIEHPVANIPRIYEAIEDDGRLVVIEEYINGTSLQQIISSGRISEVEAAEITKKLCRIVLDLHNCVPPIVHRDIKPTNIILMDDGTVKLLDMNAAKQYIGAAEQDTQLIGTAGFAAPEQYGFGSSSVQTDMYAIGVLMAVLAYGRFSRNALSSSPYDKIIERCTRIDPSDRYKSVNEIIEALSVIRSSNQTEAQKNRFIRWLPPGFRTLNPWRMVLSLLLYAFLVAVGTGITVENAVSSAEIVLNRIFFILCSLAFVLFVGNYMDIWSAFGITKIKNRWLRLAAALLGGVVAFFVVFMLLMIIEAAIRQ